MNVKLNRLSGLMGVTSALGLALMALVLPCVHSGAGVDARVAGSAQGNGEQGQREAMPALQGAQAREYLEKTDDGRSLAEAVTAARFGLKWQDRSPFGGEGGGYLGMSHVQNLNAWFGPEGVTIRPTLTEEERDKAWRLGMRLKAYGYGAGLTDAPPVVTQKVEENRIEYVRSDSGLRITDYGLTDNSDSSGQVVSRLFNPQSPTRNPRLTEWYENKAAGVEQGFTIAAPPARGPLAAGDEPLRLVVTLAGDLRARAKQDGSQVELLDRRGAAVLSYGQLAAKDANGRALPARMEADAEGSEIALTVDDRAAVYPIEVDPITATLEQKLTRPSNQQAGAEFGDAVAISGNTAVVGAWLEDLGGSVDEGKVYIFTRSGSTWTFKFSTFPSHSDSAQCGWSVAIGGENTVAFGCPGDNSNAGAAALIHTNNDWSTATITSLTLGFLEKGDRFGESVALDQFNRTVFVGAPFFTNNTTIPHAGNLWVMDLDSNFTITSTTHLEVRTAEAHFGASVATKGDSLIIGVPGAGFVELHKQSPNGSWPFVTQLFPGDGAPGDMFGYSVAIDGDKAVVGAPLNDNAKGTDAGAAYVFVRGSNGTWTQQQKLIASDGIDQDHFGQSVAIDGNMIVVGSPYFGSKTFTGTRGNGRAYVFTHQVNNTWTEQAIVSALFDGAAGDKFGIGVGISGDTVISGAEHAAPGGTSDAGAAFVHRLSCVAPAFFFTLDINFSFSTSRTVCPGDSLAINNSLDGGSPFTLGTAPLSWQWRKNGVNIPGATARALTINDASASDAGSYDVIVTNSCGGEISEPFTLTVHSLTINPTSQNFSASGSNGIVNVSSSSGSCGWTAQSNAPWITVTSGASGAGSGTVGFTVAANTGPQRTGTITVARQTFTVTQDGAAPPATTVQFSAPTFTGAEGCAPVTVTVIRTGDTSGSATVDYATSDGAATEHSDYTTALGTLRFAPGEAQKTFDLLLTQDSFVEGNETFNVTLSNPSGAALGSQATAAVRINDGAASPSNPIDGAGTYVCQHYHDFLNRQGDASGLSFWTGGITGCGSDAVCLDVKRVNTSAAFFLSIEFQQTGYQVIRIYKATFTDSVQHPRGLPRYREFLRDTQEIGRGVVVGQGNWQQQLQLNRQDFVRNFVQRADFLALFPSDMAAGAYVDKLFADSGVTPTTPERDAAVAAFGAGGVDGRAAALLSVTNSGSVYNRQYNPAFVLMQYLGYLRRNPDDAPDGNFSGFDFWLSKLDTFSQPGEDMSDDSQAQARVQRAEMVKAFITSIEYRQRFGTP